MGLHYLFRDFMPICDKWVLADNSEVPFKVVAEGDKDGMIVRDTARFATIKKMNEAYEKQLAAERKAQRQNR
jgi:hypothetical protein